MKERACAVLLPAHPVAARALPQPPSPAQQGLPTLCKVRHWGPEMRRWGCTKGPSQPPLSVCTLSLPLGPSSTTSQLISDTRIINTSFKNKRQKSKNKGGADVRGRLFSTGERMDTSLWDLPGRSWWWWWWVKWGITTPSGPLGGEKGKEAGRQARGRPRPWAPGC